MSIVGRQSELGALDRMVEALIAGKSRRVEITGEAGVGKTRLLTELAERAQKRDCLVLTGRAAEFECDLPFALIVDALDSFLGTWEGIEQAGFDEYQLSQLYAVFPSLGIRNPQLKAGPPADRFGTYRALRDLIDAIARERPLVLCLDDVHWSDVASTEALCHLLRRPPEAPLAIAITLRPGYIPAQLAVALADGEREGGLERIALAPFTFEEAAEFVGDRIGPLALERIYKESGGVPLFLEQLARQRGESPQLSPGGRRAAADDEVPSTIRDVIALEVGALPEQACRVLQVAAVVGDRAEASLVAEVAELPEAEVFDAIDTLAARDLVRYTGAGQGFQFRHPIVRRAVYDALKPGWRLGAHARVATALAARHAPAPKRAYHIERSAPSGDLDAVAGLTEAASQVAMQAPAAAAAWFEAALRILPERPDTQEQRLNLSLGVAIALGSSGQLSRSGEALRGALSLIPADRPELRMQMLHFDASVKLLQGRFDDARTQLISLEQASGPGTSETAEAKARIAITSMFACEFDEMLTWARGGVSEQSAHLGTLALTTSVLAVAEQCNGNMDAGLAAIDRAAALVADIDDEDISGRVALFTWLAWAELVAGRFEDALEHLDRAIRLARRHGHDHLVAQMLFVQSLALMWKGDLAGALKVSGEASELAEMLSNDFLKAMCFAARSWVESRVGQYVEAAESAVAAVAAAESVGSPFLIRVARCCLAQVMLAAGQTERCFELLAPSEDMTLPELPFAETHWYGVLARAMAGMGLPIEAALAARWATEHAERYESNFWTGMAEQCSAELELGEGDAEPAAILASSAIAKLGSSGARIEAATARVVLGEAFAELGKRDEAIEQLLISEEELAAARVEADRARAARALRALGKRVGRHLRSRRPATGIASLSPRELEIARLIHAGNKNREIAATLFLSPKTIEMHVSNILQKLGVPSRTQVATIVERELGATHDGRM